MRQYLGIYNEALASMRDINYLIAIDTRYIGEAAGAGQGRRAGRARVPLHELVPARDAQRARRAHRLQRPEPVPAARRSHAAPGERRRRARGRQAHDLLRPRELRHEAQLRHRDRRLRRLRALPVRARARSRPKRRRCSTQFLELDRPLRVQKPGERAARRAQGAGQARRLLPRAGRRGEGAH